MDLKGRTGAAITPKIKIKLSVVSEPHETLMEGVDADISLGAVESTDISTLGEALQLMKSIMDIVAGVCYH